MACAARLMGIACDLVHDTEVHSGSTTTENGGSLRVTWTYTAPGQVGRYTLAGSQASLDEVLS